MSAICFARQYTGTPEEALELVEMFAEIRRTFDGTKRLTYLTVKGQQEYIEPGDYVVIDLINNDVRRISKEKFEREYQRCTPDQ